MSKPSTNTSTPSELMRLISSTFGVLDSNPCPTSLGFFGHIYLLIPTARQHVIWLICTNENAYMSIGGGTYDVNGIGV